MQETTDPNQAVSPQAAQMTRGRFIQEAEAQLTIFTARLEQLRQDVERLAGNAKAAGRADLSELHVKLGEARKKFEATRAVPNEKWEQARASLERTWNEIRALFERKSRALPH